MGGEPALVIYSAPCAAWNVGGLDADIDADTALECCAADIFASNDWNDALGYNAPTPGGKIGDGGVLNQTKKQKNEHRHKIKFNVNEAIKWARGYNSTKGMKG